MKRAHGALTQSETSASLKTMIETWDWLREQSRIDFPLLTENERALLCSKAMDRIFNLKQAKGDRSA